MIPFLSILQLFAVCLGAQASSPDRSALIDKISNAYGLSSTQKQKLTEVFSSSRVMGQGNSSSTVHPATREQCEAKLKTENHQYLNSEFTHICGSPYMAPLVKSGTDLRKADTCIDQFEFPNIPCEYPVVWTTARQAAEACEAVGKRLCDAHEWEGACDGSLENPDYAFHLVRPEAGESANLAALRRAHNPGRKINWSYGPNYRTDVCGTGSSKSLGCDLANQTGKGVYEACGSNTYPAGYFPECKSPLGVYDINGNAAEHMSIPLNLSQMTSRGGHGLTEMKGSWFVFNKIKAHPDDCRWRAPYWHGTPVKHPKSHANYHLSFRCCKSLK